MVITKGAIYEKIYQFRGGGNRLSSYSKGFTLAEGTTCVATLEDNRLSAFTLAEVLVTLGIIGVVSAMTVPSLMQNYQRQSYVTQLHKVYNELSQAALRYQNDKNAINLKEAGLTSVAEVNNFINSYFKVVSTCDKAETPCFASSYKKMSGSAAFFEADCKSFILASGAAIRPYFNGGNSGNRILSVAVDINGQKGPNIIGRDFFILCLYNNGVIDDTDDGLTDDDGELLEVSIPISREDREKLYTNICASDSSKTTGCFGKILNDNWEMTY